MKLKVLELFSDLKIKVSDDGKIYTLDHSYLRKNGRLDNRKGKQLMFILQENKWGKD